MDIKVRSDMEFKLRRRKNKLFACYILSKEEINLFLAPFMESPVESIEYKAVCTFKNEQEAKKVMSDKETLARVPFAMQQTIPIEKFVETYLKASKLAEKKGEAEK